MIMQRLRWALLLQPRGLPADLRELTALRFFAAMWVVVLHLGHSAPMPPSSLTHLIDNGALGVDLFFILSGFILTHVYAREAAGQRFKTADFLWSRLARIYPLHLVTALAMIALMALAMRLDVVGGSALLWQRYIASNLTLTHAWGFFDFTGLNWPSWSVSAEWAAYLAFPLLLPLVVRGFARPKLFLALATAGLIGGLAALEALAQGPVVAQTARFALLRIGPEFVFGCALYAVARQTTFNRPAMRAGFWLTLAAVLTLEHLTTAHLAIIPLLGLLIFFLAQRAKWWDPSPLADRRLLSLGESSYALYLVHSPLFFVLFVMPAGALGDGSMLFSWAYAWIALPLALALGWSAHVGVERPARTFLRGHAPSTWGLGAPPFRS